MEWFYLTAWSSSVNNFMVNFFHRNIYVMYMFVNVYNFDQYWRERRDLRLKMIILSLVYVECDYFFFGRIRPPPTVMTGAWWTRVAITTAFPRPCCSWAVRSVTL